MSEAAGDGDFLREMRRHIRILRARRAARRAASVEPDGGV